MAPDGLLRRSLLSVSPRALASWTLGLTVLALAATYLARMPCCTRMGHPIFLRLFAFDDFNAAAVTAALCVLTLALAPLRRAGTWLADCCALHPGRVLVVALVGLSALVPLAYLDHALSMDEYAPRLQAHAFASGTIGAAWPPQLLDRIISPGFQGYFFFTHPATGLATSAYWPGLALLMTPLARFNAEGLLNPALAVLSLALIYSIASTLAGDRRAGGWALLLTLASPAFTVNAISFYAMNGLLTLDLLFAWLLMRGGLGSSALAGLAGGLALVLHNPVPHALFALPWLLWLLADRSRWPRLAAVAAGYLPFGIGIGAGWPLLMQHLGLDPLVASPDPQGFAAGWLHRLQGIFQLPGEELLTARFQATWKLWIWAAPGLLVLAALGLRRSIGQPWTRLLVASLACTYAFYFLVSFDQGHGWGYRYLQSAWGVLPILGGLVLASPPAGAPQRQWRETAGALALAGLLVTPLFLWQVHRNVAESLAWRTPVPPTGYWLDFVDLRQGYYVGDVVQNLPGATRVLTLVSQGEDSDAALAAQYFPSARHIRSDRHGSLWQLSAPPLPLQR